MIINSSALPVRNEIKEIRQDLQDGQDIFCLSGRKAKSIIALKCRFSISAKAGLTFTLLSGMNENNKSEKSC
jgi:hypothetical protein